VRDWFESWFGEEYVALYPHRDAAEAEHAVEMVETHASASFGSKVLDLACGGGRHSRLLSQQWRTVGLDLSPALLRLARKQAPEAEFVRGDMRVLPFRSGTFEIVVNLFTSFGYFEDDRSHLRVIKEVGRVTAAQGVFVLDFLNTEHIRETLVPYDEKVIGGMVVEQRREISEDGRYVTKRICIRDGSREFTERVRLFEKDELSKMMERSGFRVTSVFGSYDGSPLTDDSPRVILFGTRS
jgi:ubiquinone/menaquinone biosynthesis C-methylase UbiE